MIAPARWAHVPTVELFSETGVALVRQSEEKHVGPHPHKHDSRSGTCLVVWQEEGRWWCSSCKAKGDLQDWLVDVGKVADRKEAEKWLAEKYGPPARVSNLPVIVANNRQLDEITEDALEALKQSNHPPHLFVRGAKLSRVVQDEDGQYAIDFLSPGSMRGLLSRSADFVTYKTVKDKDTGDSEETAVNVFPPKGVVDDIISLGRWPGIPPLTGLISSPVVSPGGEVITKPGYHASSGLYYAGKELNLPPLKTDAKAVQEAVWFIFDELLKDFMFADQASWTHSLALLLQGFIRHYIQGPAPLYAIDAPGPGSGKGLLADACSLPSAPKGLAVMTVGKDEDEWRKRITSLLLTGKSHILVDNMHGKLASGALEAALTAYPDWEDRFLGTLTMVRVPQMATWIITGNNLLMSDEAVRRAVWIRLDPLHERPWLRTRFRHPNLRGWARENRAKLVHAALTLIAAWFAEGCPRYTGRLPGSFEEWASIMGGIMQVAGVGKFLDNSDALYEQLDPERQAWLAFIDKWLETYLPSSDSTQTAPVGVADLYSLAKDNELLTDVINARNEQGEKVRLGTALRNRLDRVFGSWQIKKAGSAHRAVNYVLVYVGESGESFEDSPSRVRARASESESSASRLTEDESHAHALNPPGGESGESSNPPRVDEKNLARAREQNSARGEKDSPDSPEKSLESWQRLNEGVPEHERSDRKTHQDSPAVSYEYITDADRAAQVVSELLTEPVIGLDTETTGLNPIQDRIRLVQLASSKAVHIVDVFHVSVDVLAPALSGGPVKVIHNAKYDASMFWETQGGGMPEPVYDTLLADQVIHNRNFPRSLVDVAKDYLGVELSKEQRLTDWSAEELTEEQLQYAARDAAVLLPLHEAIKAKARDHGLTRIVEIENQALPAIVWMERSGVYFDREPWNALLTEAKSQAEALREELNGIVSDALGSNGLFGMQMNWDSTQQVLETLQRLGLNVSDTREESLEAFKNQHPAIPVLLAYREATKKVGTYGDKWAEYINDVTGRIHADWRQIGAEPGRMACRKPNLQQLPRDKAYRACFRAEEGNVLIKCDYSQIQLRILAQITEDKRMLQAFREGKDIHTLTALFVTGKQSHTEITPEERQAAKAVNFGLAFGMGARGFAQYARRNYGVELTEEQAKETRNRYFSAFQGLQRWHRRQKNVRLTRTILGRVREFGKDYRYTELFNSPVQGAEADGLKLALARMWETRHEVTAFPVLVVHDEVVIEVAEHDAEIARVWLERCMREGMAEVVTAVPVEVESEERKTW